MDEDDIFFCLVSVLAGSVLATLICTAFILTVSTPTNPPVQMLEGNNCVLIKGKPYCPVDVLEFKDSK